MIQDLIVLNTCERPDLLFQNIKRFNNQNKRFLIFQDGKNGNYGKVKTWLKRKQYNFVWYEWEHKHGKLHFWIVHREMWAAVQKERFENCHFIQDDCFISHDYFETVNQIFNQIDTEVITTLTVNAHDDLFLRKPIIATINNYEVFETNYIDCNYAAKRSFFESMNWQAPRVELPDSKVYASGVGAKLRNNYLINGGKIYQVKQSLLEHVGVESVIGNVIEKRLIESVEQEKEVLPVIIHKTTSKNIKDLIIMTTCERPDLLLENIKQIKDIKGKEILIFQDGKYDYQKCINYLKRKKFIFSWYVWGAKHGKKRFWQIHNYIFSETKRKEFELCHHIQDDCLISHDYFETINEIFKNEKIEVLNTLVVNCHLSRYRGQKEIYKYKNIKVYNLNKLDCNYVAKRSFFEKLNWEVKKISRNFDFTYGSGVGSHTTERYVKGGGVIFNVLPSLLNHIGYESKIDNKLSKEMITSYI